MKVKKTEEATVEQPPLAPFIDVVFQLLIFFMLSMKFKATEGYLLSTLPRDKGLFSNPVENPEMEEVRVYICAHMDQRMDQHIGYKEKHQDHLIDQRKAGQPVGDVCNVWLELNFNQRVQVYRTSKYPSKYAENKRVYEQVADQVKDMLTKIKSSRDPTKPAPVIIDCDGLVPFEHPFGFLNALQKRQITNIEWAGNPRFDRYFGAGQ